MINSLSSLKSFLSSVKDVANTVSVILIYSDIEDYKGLGFIEKDDFVKRYDCDIKMENLKSALMSFGFHVKTYRSESSFMKDMLLKSSNNLFREKKIVLYMGLGGIGATKRILIPSFCNFMQIPYCNSNITGTLMSWHRKFQSSILEANGILIPKLWQYDADGSWLHNKKPDEGTKVIIKSAYECCSIGVTEQSVQYVDEKFESYLKNVTDQIGQSMVVQEFISGKEVYQSVLEADGYYLPTPIEVKPADNNGKERNFIIPKDHDSIEGISYSKLNDVPDVVINKLQKTTLQIHEILELSVMSRIDFRLTEDGVPYVFDIAETPGINRYGSAYPMAFMEHGFTYEEVLGAILGANMLKARYINYS